MFTLDRTTLFFLSLSDQYRNDNDSADDQQKAVIKNWTQKVVIDGKGHKDKTSASSAATPPLTVGSSQRSQMSYAPRSRTSRTAINNRVKIKDIDDDIVDDSEGAISERDERDGGERALAAASPHKGKGTRVTSSVSSSFGLLL